MSDYAKELDAVAGSLTVEDLRLIVKALRNDTADTPEEVARAERVVKKLADLTPEEVARAERLIKQLEPLVNKHHW